MIFTIEAENVKTVLATKFKDYELPSRRKTAMNSLLGWGIFTNDGADWKHSRELIRPNFARDQVADLENFEEHVNFMIHAIPKDGKTTVDLQELFFGLTIDTATEFLFGESTNVLLGRDSPESTANLSFAEAFNRSQLEVQNQFRSSIFYRPPKHYKGDTKIVKDYIGKYVKQGLQYRKDFIRDPEKAASRDGRYVFMYELVKAIDDPVRVRDEMLNVLLAGRDTTASLLGNLWFTLARRPDIWAKLRREVDETLHGSRPTFEQLKEMKYLKAVMNECKKTSLRQIPPLNPHSSPPRPRRPIQHPPGYNRHHPPHRRWPQRQISHPGPPRPTRRLHGLGHASATRILRLGRRRVQAGAVGTYTADVGIPTVQRRAESVHRAAVCAYGGRLYDRQVDAEVRGGGE